jgi:type I restriction enzyme M protein
MAADPQVRVLSDFFWAIANEELRDDFKRGKYQDVILPLIVLRRFDQVLEPTKEAVLREDAKLRALGVKEDGRVQRLTTISGYAFYNTSKYANFEALLRDYKNLPRAVRRYIQGFSPNVREILEKFDLDNTITKLANADLLFRVVERFKNSDLHPDRVSNLRMGTIFEDLIRRFNEALDENPGEHFTPREVVELMADLVTAPDRSRLKEPHLIRTLADPCCGTGGMLTYGKERLLRINGDLEVYLFGQESQPETYAICKADILMSTPDGRDAENIKLGSTLRKDQLAEHRFHYQLANPPYGKSWKKDLTFVKEEASRGAAGRFEAGMPRTTDGQFLFLLHMINRMKPVDEGGGRLAIIMNGSPLFSGDAGGRESEIRRWIFEHDWVEAIIGLPTELFYNTGIKTYVWLLSNRKPRKRRNRFQLIDASNLWQPLSHNLGAKRRELGPSDIKTILQVYMSFEEGELSQLHSLDDFGYRKVRVQRPLRCSFGINRQGLRALTQSAPFRALAKSKRKNKAEREKAEAAGREKQKHLTAVLEELGKQRFASGHALEESLALTLGRHEITLTSTILRVVLKVFSAKDQDADIWRGRDGRPLADSDLRSYERVPLGVDPESFVDQVVRSQVADAWLDESLTDKRDGGIGLVGYEVNFNRFFFRLREPRSVEEIDADILSLEREIASRVEEVAG